MVISIHCWLEHTDSDSKSTEKLTNMMEMDLKKTKMDSADMTLICILGSLYGIKGMDYNTILLLPTMCSLQYDLGSRGLIVVYIC